MDWRKKMGISDENVLCIRTETDWINRMNSAMSYIEDNLTGKIKIGAVARTACCSAYHFQRFFPYIAGITLSEYIRRRRLTLAAFDLQNSNAKVIDVAFKYGYESPESFARAFKNMHGVVPNAAKEKGTQLRAYPCISFHISIRGDVEMDYRIEQREELGLFGVTTEISAAENQNHTTVSEFWENCRADGTMARIRKAANVADNTPLHGAMFNCTESSYAYMIGFFTPASGAPDGFSTVTVPASLWAVFTTEELSIEETTQQTAALWKRIFTEWFATSGYELAPNVPELELHHKASSYKYITEILIPIINGQ